MWSCTREWFQHGGVHGGFSRGLPGQQSLPADPSGQEPLQSPVVMGGQAGTSQSEAGPSSHSLGFSQSEDALERFQKALMEMCPPKLAVVRWAERKMKH